MTERKAPLAMKECDLRIGAAKPVARSRRQWKGFHDFTPGGIGAGMVLAVSRGITLVELVVSLAIFGVIAGVAARSFLQAAEVRRQVEQRTQGVRAVSFLFDRLRSDIASLVPGSVGGLEPFEVGSRPTGEMVYRLVRRIPPTESSGNLPVGALAECRQYWVGEREEGRLTVFYSRQYIGAGGLLDEPAEAVLESGVTAFALSPTYESREGQNAVPTTIEVAVGTRMNEQDTEMFRMTFRVFAKPKAEKE